MRALKRLLLLVTAVVVCVDAAPAHRSDSGSKSWSEYVTMRDGVKLAVDVHVSKGLAAGERTATILHMSRYYRSVDVRTMWKLIFGGLYPITERDIREEFVRAGYSWVDVDVRGAGASFGRRDYPLSPEEVQDGADLLDWIVRQPWASGAIGATGSSYDGALALLLLRNHHPALKAVAPRFAGWDAYDDIFLPGGLHARGLLHDWSRLVGALDRGRLTDVFGWTAGVMTPGVRPVDPRLLPAAIAEHDDNVDTEQLVNAVTFRDDTPPGRHVTIDDLSPHTVKGVEDVPIYSYAGWFDAALPRGQVHAYLAHRGPGSRLRLGPWFHAGEFNASPYANGRKRDFDHAAELIRFFDYHLRGIDRGFTGDAPVSYYTMGAERWHTASSWPPPGTHTKSLFLEAAHTLSWADPSQEDGTSDRYEVTEAATTGVGSRWGLIVGTGIHRGYGDQREQDRLRLTYTTPPLESDVEVTGHPVVRLLLDASAPDSAVFAYLEDVRPTGEVHYVTEGQLRLIHRKVSPSLLGGDPVPFHTYLRRDAAAMTPGAPAEVTFDLLPTSILFRAGHSIRFSIAGADAGSFDAPPHGSTPVVYRVHRGSRINLPTFARRP